MSEAAPYGLRCATSGAMYIAVPQRDMRRGESVRRRLVRPSVLSPKSASLTCLSFLVTKGQG